MVTNHFKNQLQGQRNKSGDQRWPGTNIAREEQHNDSLSYNIGLSERTPLGADLGVNESGARWHDKLEMAAATYLKNIMKIQEPVSFKIPIDIPVDSETV